MDPGDSPLSLEVQYGTLVAPNVTRGMIKDPGEIVVLPIDTKGKIVNPGGSPLSLEVQ